MLWSLVLGVGIARADHDSEAAHDPGLLFWVIVLYGGSPTKAASRVTGVWVSSRPIAANCGHPNWFPVAVIRAALPRKLMEGEVVPSQKH
jgi:hypothetical protein